MKERWIAEAWAVRIVKGGESECESASGEGEIQKGRPGQRMVNWHDRHFNLSHDVRAQKTARVFGR